jgi:cytochrome bd ubiquinol oxidase subunit I
MAAVNTVLWSRLVNAETLTFHVIFATLGVGIPLMIALAEWIGIRKRDSHYIVMAKRWMRGFVISVAVGVVTGTIIALQLTLVWPNFMQLAGNVIALPLFMEVFAFFIEAIFMGIYLYTWDRFRSPTVHWLLILPVVVAGGMSAFFITSVNAFMNHPEGFVLEGGRFTAVYPLQAMLNEATPSKVLHVLTSAYMTSAALLAGIAAYVVLKKGPSEYNKKVLRLMMAVTFIFGALNVITGDGSAKFLAAYQPEKLAAMEWLFQTSRGVELLLFGWMNAQHQVIGAITIPKLLSFLAFDNFNAEVKGLNEFPPDERPPLVIHYLFNIMAGIGFTLPAITVLYFVILIWRRRLEFNKWLLRLILLCAPLAFLAIELGWYTAEIGRQPWILRGYLRVDQAATTSPSIKPLFFVFLLLYIILALLSVMILRRLFRNNPAEVELKAYMEQRQIQSEIKGEQT